MSYNANGGSGTTSSHTSPQYYNTYSAETISGVTFTTVANGFTRTGYSFSKWANDSANGTQVSAGENAAEFKPDVDKSTTAELTKTMYAIWTANEISFANQTITKTFSTSAQTETITDAMKPTNGTGTYTYEKKSGEADISVASNGTITIPASKTANTTGYTIVITATDSETLKKDDAS